MLERACVRVLMRKPTTEMLFQQRNRVCVACRAPFGGIAKDRTVTERLILKREYSEHPSVVKIVDFDE